MKVVCRDGGWIESEAEPGVRWGHGPLWLKKFSVICFLSSISILTSPLSSKYQRAADPTVGRSLTHRRDPGSRRA